MIKKNKLSLFLLAVVMMLSVYYINMPETEDSTGEVGSGDVVTKYSDFAEQRLEILAAREELILEFENVLASADANTEAKDVAYTSMQDVFELTEKEVALEQSVMDMGFLDCLVQAEDQTVVVTILTASSTTDDFIAIKLMTSEAFGSTYRLSIVWVDPDSSN